MVNGILVAMKGWSSRDVPQFSARVSTLAMVAMDAARDEEVWTVGLFGPRFGTRVPMVKL